MKSVGTKFYLFAGITILLFALFLLYRTYSVSHLFIDQLAEQHAEMLLKFDRSMRKNIAEMFHSSNIQYDPQEKFISQVMSASFAAHAFFTEMGKDFNGIVVRIASHNPRNPANKATPEEMQLLDYFTGNPGEKEWRGELQMDGKQYSAYIQALRVEESCLYCHGDPASAPQELVGKFGDMGGFHRDLGEVSALEIVAIPLSGPLQHLRTELMQNGFIVGAGFLLVLITLFVHLRLFIINRLSGMANYFVRIARRDEYLDIEPLPITGKDEISALARSFNILAQKLRRYNLNQDQQLQALTTMNEELQQQITERRRAERAMRNSEEKYRDLFEESRDAVYITSREGKFIDFNQAALDLFGYDREEMGEIDTASIYVNPEDRQAFQEAIEREGAVKDYPLSLKRKDGKEMSCLLTTSVKRDPEGKIVGYQGIMRDISDKCKLEEQLQQAQKMETVGRLAGGVAHDFNNILTSIMGYSELGIRQLGPENPATESLKIIRDAGEQAANLTRRLLAFSRKQMLEMRVLCPSAVVINMGKMLRRIIGEDIRLDFHVQATRNCLADQCQIEQVLMNLVVNARDAMPSGGTLTIDTFDVTVDEAFAARHSDMKEGDYVLLCVTDTGEGIGKDSLDHIFEPFFTTKKEGHGTGLGLSMVYGIVKQHNGHIFVSSEKGKGTSFRIYLPASEVEEPAKRFVPDSAELQRGTETLLIVEDEKSIRNLIFHILEPLGYNMLGASSGEEALSLLQSYRGDIDLLLTDIVMPGMNGWQLAEKVVERFPGVRLLFMSGYSDDLLQQRDIGQSVELMVKPLTPTKLTRTIRNVLDRKG